MPTMETISLAYCEIDYLILRPNTHYIFIPIEGCAKCDAKLKEYGTANAC